MSTLLWRDAVVVVTGASSGIGADFARQVAPDARCVVLVARRVERLESLAAELRAAHPALAVDVRPCDLGDSAAVTALAAALLDSHGRVDVLINNAGMGVIGLFEQGEPDKINAMLQVNIVGLTLLTRALLPAMVAAGRGGVLNVSSGFGLTWMPMFAAYVGSKHYVTAFTESVRAECWGTGVHITQLCPGPVATEFEQVAGNPTGQEVPAFIQLQPADCAAAGLRALRRNRAMIVPGVLAAMSIWLGERSPRWVLRIVYGLVGSQMRRTLAAR